MLCSIRIIQLLFAGSNWDEWDVSPAENIMQCLCHSLKQVHGCMLQWTKPSLGSLVVWTLESLYTVTRGKCLILWRDNHERDCWPVALSARQYLLCMLGACGYLCSLTAHEHGIHDSLRRHCVWKLCVNSWKPWGFISLIWSTLYHPHFLCST